MNLMCEKRLLLAVCLSAWFIATPAFAQDTRAEQLEQEKIAKAANVQPEQREAGDLIITRLQQLFMPAPPAWRLTAGDFRPSAGFGAGVAYVAPLGHALWTTKAAWSIMNFKQAQTALELPPIAAGRVHASTFFKWNDAPALPYFGLGNASSRANEVHYGLRWVEAGIDVQVRAGRQFHYGGAFGYFGAHSSNGSGSDSSIGNVFTDAGAPGLGSAPTWVHSSAFAAFDTRESPGYTQSGALYQVTLHRYADDGGQYTFSQTQIDLRQFIPVLNHNWVIALQGLANMTATAEGQTVPYFMLPTVGGRDSLPGFGQYRFADRNSLLLRSELRWSAAPLLDVAAIFDQGKVAPKPTDLDLKGLKSSVGFGVRIHSLRVTALRIDVARSSEGWRLNFTHGFSF